MRPKHPVSRSVQIALLAAAAASEIMSVRAADAKSPDARNTESVAQLKEVVVTARMRSENLQEVPVAVSVISGDSLLKKGIENTTDMYGRIPGLYFSQNNSVGQNPDAQFIVIRGVGSNPVLEPSVGLFIDGVYQSSAGFDIDFLDLDRVEVLRGPQGTLFGRNTEAGAINLITHQPGNKFHAKVFSELGNYNTYKLRGTVEGPIGDHWAASISTGYQTTSGWLHNATLNRDQNAERTLLGRLELRYFGNGPLEVRISADGSRTRGGLQGIGVLDTIQGYNTFDSTPNDENRYNYGLAAHVDYSLQHATLTSISAYRRTYTNYGQDITGLAVPVGDFQNIIQRQYTASEELRLASADADSAVKWLVGAYYFHELNDTYFTLQIPDTTGFLPANSFYTGLNAFIDADSDRHGWAGFGQVTWRPWEMLELTGGFRYSNENIGFSWENVLTIAPLALTIDNPRQTPPGGPLRQGEASPMGSVTLHWSKTLMTYVSVAKGYKAGGFDRFATDPNGLTPFRAETALSYELGTKWTSLDGRVAGSADIFYIDIRNQQLLANIPGAEGIPTTTIANAGRAASKGAEFEVRARPIPQLLLHASGSYTDAYFKQYLAPNGSGLLNLAGTRVPNVPLWQGSADAQYSWKLSSDYRLSLSGDYRFVSSYQAGAGIATDPSFHIPSYSIADFSLDLGAANWQVGIFVRNAFDRYVITNRTYAFFFAQVPSSIRDTVLAPRTYGINLNYNW